MGIKIKEAQIWKCKNSYAGIAKNESVLICAKYAIKPDHWGEYKLCNFGVDYKCGPRNVMIDLNKDQIINNFDYIGHLQDLVKIKDLVRKCINYLPIDLK